jgi:hypothetical protein
MSALRAKLRIFGPAILIFGAAWLIVGSLTRAGSLLPLWAREQTPPAAQLHVHVHDDGGGPLAEVQVRTAGRVLGATDAAGSFRARVVVLAGGSARFDQVRVHGAAAVEVQCPEAYRTAAAQTLALAAAELSLSFVCRPKLRTVALVVHAPSARGSVVRADQQSLGRIDDEGVLHAVLRKAPGSTLSLAVETHASEVPASARAPSESPIRAVRQELVVEDRDSVVLFDPALPMRSE